MSREVKKREIVSGDVSCEKGRVRVNREREREECDWGRERKTEEIRWRERKKEECYWGGRGRVLIERKRGREE